MRCINCGWDNLPGAVTCVKCGQVLEGGAEVPQGAPASMPFNGDAQMSRPTVVGVQQIPESRPTVVGAGVPPAEPLSRPTTVMQPGQMGAPMAGAQAPRPTVVGVAGMPPQPAQAVAGRATVSQPADKLANVSEMPPMPASEDGSCPSCGYPIVGSPAKCPACGQVLSAAQQPSEPVAKTMPDAQYARADAGNAIPPAAISRQTVVGDFAHHVIEKPQPQQRIPRCSLTLIPEETEDNPGLKNDYEGDSVVLSRHNTEPDNRTITSREQAVLTHEDGQWFIEDRSDLKSTFIRVSHKMPLQPGDVIVLGDRRFTFNEE